jgi:carboxyl-terminal processing protease
MRKLLLAVCSVVCIDLPAQTAFTKTANEAAVVTAMVQKFHVQPKPVDDQFSTTVFHLFLTQLDRQKIFFTAEDVQSLAPFKDKLDDEIKNRQTNFLQKVTAIYQQRLRQADAVVDSLGKQPFNFNLAEKLTLVEDTSYAINEAALRNKMYKKVKRTVLMSMLDIDQPLTSLSSAQQKKFVDSAEAINRKKIVTMIRRSIKRKLQSPGGIEQIIGEEYCKAIAGSFDPHTAYMPETEKEDFESELGQKAMGFGFSLDEDGDGKVVINDLKAGSPAFKSGQLNDGDKIESIQWEGKEAIDVTTASMEEIARILTVSNHAKANIKIKKADGSSRQVTLVKEQLEANEEDEEKVKSYVLKGTKAIGYISLPAFYEDWENEEANVNGCANDVAKEIIKLKKENIDGLILDVRYNGGGSLREAVELAGIFIDAGPVAMMKNKEQKIFTLKDANRGTIYDGPLMLLVNGYSASASELLAGTLQDYHRAVIVGTPTYGKATGQVILPLDTTITLDKDFRSIKTEGYIKTTMSQLYRVNGTTAQAIGVQPDILLPDLLDAYPEREGDNQMVLRSANIESNKYFKPLEGLSVAGLQAAANSRVDTSAYFKAVKSYVDVVKKSKVRSDLSLRFSDVLQTLQQQQPVAPAVENEAAATSFTILNSAFELQRMKANSNLKEVNEEWKHTLSKDAYVKLAYELMLLLK